MKINFLPHIAKLFGWGYKPKLKAKTPSQVDIHKEILYRGVAIEDMMQTMGWKIFIEEFVEYREGFIDQLSYNIKKGKVNKEALNMQMGMLAGMSEAFVAITNIVNRAKVSKATLLSSNAPNKEAIRSALQKAG